MSIIFLSLFGIIYFTACSGKKVNLQPPTNESPSAQATGSEISFASVKPLFNQYCVQCHLSGGNPDLSEYEKAKSVATKIKNFVSSGYMPLQDSEEAKAITEEERNKIISWVNAGAPLEAVQQAPQQTMAAMEPPKLPAALDTINQCMNCHGGNGISTSSNNPNLGGQDESYLKNQLLDFKSGKRVNQTMNGIAKDLTLAEIEMLSTFFASLYPSDDQAQAKTVAIESLYGDAKKPLGVVSCAGCHASYTFQASPLPNDYMTSPVPTLNGQKADYIVSQFKKYHSGERQNSIMNQVANQQLLIDEDGNLNLQMVQDIADYFSQLPVHNINEYR